MFWGKTKRVPPLIFHALDDVKKVFFIYREPCVDPFWSLNEMILFLYFSYQITTFFPLWCISSPSLAVSMVRSGLLIRECSSHELTCSMADNWAISIAHMVEGTARTEKLLVFPNKSNVLVPLHLSCCWSLETEKDPCSSSAHYILQSYRITTTYRCCLWQGFLLEKNWEVSPLKPCSSCVVWYQNKFTKRKGCDSSCSSRGPKFKFHHPWFKHICNSGSRGSTALFGPLQAPDIQEVHRFACEQNIHTGQIKMKKIIKNKKAHTLNTDPGAISPGQSHYLLNTVSLSHWFFW